MKNVLVNALASTAGGGRTWLTNVLPRLEQIAGNEIDWTVLVPPSAVNEYQPLTSARLKISTANFRGGAAGRWWWEQNQLRHLIHKEEIALLVSVGNFALWRSPIPQILFNRSDLNFSPEFQADLARRQEWGMWCGQIAKSWLAQQSIREATINVVPTQAFGERIRQAIGQPNLRYEVLMFGFDVELFRSEKELAVDEIRKLSAERDAWRLLYVSHYNYFRNFETLLRALPAMSQMAEETTGRRVELVLTTKIVHGVTDGGYDSTSAAILIKELDLGRHLRMIGAIPYRQLHHLYSICDLFVCPSYAESFGHPLLEAMACGLPLATADLPVHREVCAGAAATFDPFDPGDVARCCAELLADPTRREKMRSAGLARAGDFSWEQHVTELIELVRRV